MAEASTKPDPLDALPDTPEVRRLRDLMPLWRDDGGEEDFGIIEADGETARTAVAVLDAALAVAAASMAMRRDPGFRNLGLKTTATDALLAALGIDPSKGGGHG